MLKFCHFLFKYIEKQKIQLWRLLQPPHFLTSKLAQKWRYYPLNPNSAVREMDINLVSILKFSEDHGLLINESKSAVLCIESYKQRFATIANISCDLLLNNSFINFSNSFNNLSITLDDA